MAQQLLGVDWSSNILEVALQKSATHIDYEVKLEDVEKLTFADNVFDSVVDTFGLEYYANPSKALSEMKRVCKKDGLIMLMASGMGFYDLLNLFLNFKTPYTVCEFGYFPNRQWEEYVREEDFEILKRERKMNGTVYLYILKNSKK
jgi:methyltransferase OMS1